MSKVFFRRFFSFSLTRNTCHRYICLTNVQSTLSFQHKSDENSFAYQVIQKKVLVKPVLISHAADLNNIKEQFGVISLDDLNLSEAQHQLLYSFFVYFSSEKNKDLSNSETKKIQEWSIRLSNCLKTFSEKQLIEILESILLWPNHEEFFPVLWKEIGQELLCRLSDMNLTTISEVLKIWYPHKNIKFHEFHQQAMKKCAPHITEMNANELVDYLFFINLLRHFPKELDQQSLERHLLKLWSHFQIDDLSVISMAFFKTKHEIKDLDLLRKMISQVKRHASTINEMTLAAVLKIVRYSLSSSVKGREVPTVYSVYDAFLDQIPRLDPKALTHLVLLTSGLENYHLSTLERVAQNFSQSMQETRLKDLERLSIVLVNSGHSSANTTQFWDKVETELIKSHRQPEIQTHPRSFIALLAAFVMSGRYPEELLRIAFQPALVEKALATSYGTTKQELQLLYESVKIERPLLNLPRISALSTTLKSTEVGKNKKDSSLNHSEKFLRTLLEDVHQLLGGKQFAVASYIKPHFIYPVIVFRANLQGRLMETNESSINVAAVLNSDCKWFALVPGMRSMYSYSNQRREGKLKGPHQMKMRQLSAMGFHISLIPFFTYLKSTREDRLTYLRNRIELPLIK